MDAGMIMMLVYFGSRFVAGIVKFISYYGTRKKEEKNKERRIDGHYIGFEWCDNKEKEVIG